MGDCVTEQKEIFQGTGEEPESGDDAEADNEPWGAATSSMETIVPEGWIEPATDSMTPSGYLTKLLSEVQDKHYPTREQLQVLAVFVEHLDVVELQEVEGAWFQS